MFKSAFLYLLFACCAINVSAQNLSPAVGYPVGSSPLAVVGGDFNGDGKLDLVTADSLESSLALLLGNGDGTFAAAVAIPVNGAPNSLAVADFNSDGKLDIAVSYMAVNGLQPLIQILYGNGDGTFQPPITVMQSIAGVGLSSGGKIVAADVNGDGKPDLLAAVNGVTVFINDGSGSFTQAGTAMAGQSIEDFAVTDINGDGKPDIAALGMSVGSSGTTGQGFLAFGNGDGTFQAANPLPLTTMTPGGIAVGDFNQDGRVDIAVSNYGEVSSSSATNGSIQIALQQPDGSFANSSTLTSVANPWKIVVADFNGDGCLDIAALSISVPDAPSDPNAVFVFLGNGDGTFQSANQFSLTGTPWNLTAAKFSNSTVPDIATANAVSGTISMLVNHAPAPTPTPTPIPTPTPAPTVISSVKNPTSTSFASNNNPAKAGQTISFFATVNPPQGSTKTPTGTVIFMDGSQVIGTETLNASATGSISTSALTAGAHSVSAVYNGDANYTSSTSQIMAQTVQPQDTSAVNSPFTIASSLNASVYGQLVTFTATGTFTCPNCTSAPGNPSGTVTFYDGTTQIGSSVLGGISATLTTSSLIAGSHNISVQFTSTNSAFGGGSGGPLVQTVNQSGSGINIGTSLSPSVYGQPISITVIVGAVSPGAGTPTGSVILMDGSTNLGTLTLSSAQAKLTLSTLAAGTHSITASYQGDNNFKPSASSAVTQTVNQSGTTTTVNSSANPSVYGQPVTFTANVSAVAPGGGTPTGTATFSDGATSLGTVNLSGGQASLSPSNLTVGGHSITVSYSGDSNFKSSTSSAVVQVVNKSASSVTITSSANPSVYGQTVTFTALANAVTPGAGTPTGSVIFSDGVTNIGSINLSSGQAAVTLSTLAVASHGITATYSGDNNFLSSVSSTFVQVVNKSASVASVTSSLNPAVTGQTVILTASVSAVAPGNGVPTGSFIFLDGATSLGTAAISSGSASFTTSSLAAGSHSITVVYGGDGNFLSATSQAISQVVVAPDFSLTVNPPQSTITPGQTVKTAIQLAPLNGFTGTVSLTCSGAVPQGSCTVTPASGKFVGTTPISATLTIQTTGSTSGVVSSIMPKGPWAPLYMTLAVLLLPFACSRKRGRKFALLLGTAVLAVGCGSQGASTTPSPVTPAGTYTITVEGQSGSLEHSAHVTLVVTN